VRLASVVLLVLAWVSAATASASASAYASAYASGGASVRLRQTLPAVPTPPGQTPHSGNVIRAPDGLYYWYGDSYAGFVYNKPSRYAGVIVFRSADLRHWHGPYATFDASTQYWQTTCMGFPSDLNAGCFRSKVLFDSVTDRYVMWLSTPSGYRALTSRSPLGPFTVATVPDLYDAGIPGSRGQSCSDGGDESLWSDASGSYVVFNRCGRLLLERLTPNMLEGTGRPIQIDDYPEIGPFYGAEAPSLFRGPTGTYWITFSLPACPYCQAATGIEEAPTALGPWHYAGEISNTSGGGQPSQVSVLDGDLWLYSVDLWRQPPGWPDVSEAAARQRWERLRFTTRGIRRLTEPSRFTVTLPTAS
jgi:hypothetical protein